VTVGLALFINQIKETDGPGALHESWAEVLVAGGIVAIVTIDVEPIHIPGTRTCESTRYKSFDPIGVEPNDERLSLLDGPSGALH